MESMIAKNRTDLPICEACGSRDWKLVGGTDGGDYLCCRACGFHVQEVCPRSGQQQSRFEEEQQRFYGEEPLCVTPLFAYLQQQRYSLRIRVLRWFLQSGRILEVGPGGGELLASLRALGYQVDAVEHSPALAEAIRTRWGITVHGGAFEELSFGEEAYDALLSFHVIEHVPDVAAHLAKAAQVVRRGGYFLLATPNAGSWEHRIPLGLSPNYSSAHLQLFSPRSLTLFLQRAGWQVVEMSTPSYADAWLRVASSFARRLRGKKRVAERGRFARSGSTRSRRACVQLFSVATLPCRRIQEYLNGGNELFVVAKRE